MMKKLEKPKENSVEDEIIVEEYKTKIQIFMTDYKILVKRNPNNWVQLN